MVEAVLIAASAADIPLEFEAAFDLERQRAGRFLPAEAVYETEFTPDDLARRQTSRLEYGPGRLTAEELADARTQLAGGAELHDIPTRDLVDLAVVADRFLFEAPAVVEELRTWLRLSPRHPRYEQDGLSYECLGLRRIEGAAFALLLEPRMYRLARALHVHRLFAGSTKALLEGDGSALVVTGAAETPEQVLEHGRSLLRVWLALARHGLHTHPLSQILDCPATQRELVTRIGATSTPRLLSVFRVGRSGTPARSHRLR